MAGGLRHYFIQGNINYKKSMTQKCSYRVLLLIVLRWSSHLHYTLLQSPEQSAFPNPSPQIISQPLVEFPPKKGLLFEPAVDCLLGRGLLVIAEVAT